MKKIKLLYARNIISRKSAQQELSFLLLVHNLAFEKTVEVRWAGEDGVWHSLPAAYHGAIDGEKEYWLATTALALADDQPLPGNVEFAVRYCAAGSEYWDNNDGGNHNIQADSGIKLGADCAVQNVEFETRLAEQQRLVPVVVAVNSGLGVRRVSIEWSTDDWRSTQQSNCRYRRNYWDSEFLSNARNPNHYGCQVWQAGLRIGDAFRLRYRISCETRRHEVLQDDACGHDYVVERRPLTVMILNLHCCQEEEQDRKLSQIARAIDELGVDIVCLQEVAELWNDGRGDWQTNTARIINERIAAPYQLVTDWSHLGFGRYREGVAVLSRYPVENHRARYVSSSTDPYSIHSRKVVMARVRVPRFGLINVFSSHLSWWEDGFAEQFGNLRRWASEEHGDGIAASMLCGDFNIKAGARGYQLVVESREYHDQYLAATSPLVFDKVFAAMESGWPHYLDDDQRIDYVFLRQGSQLRVTSARSVFSDQDYGRVSDHLGYLMTFEPT
ncbi:endonuclease/exonuclease/phosphatase family protein [Accumulibacter sp.]|uniref:endonuclease/exonuclease/phosphatase family protein n=1 Tax=Accumulibacter sp. TaxID=2053492 RepID=UPI0035AE572A